MRTNPNKPLTTKQHYWLNHIHAADKAGISLSEYAKKHKLKLKSLYNYRWKLSQQGKIKTSGKQSFVRVIKKKSAGVYEPITPKTKSVRVILANKIQVEISLESNELTTLLAQVGAL